MVYAKIEGYAYRDGSDFDLHLSGQQHLRIVNYTVVHTNSAGKETMLPNSALALGDHYTVYRILYLVRPFVCTNAATTIPRTRVVSF